MEKKMSKGVMVLFLATLFSLNVALMGDMVLIPGIGGLFGAFPDKINLVNYIISGPVLISIFSALAAGKLVQYFSKKSMLIVSFGLFGIATILGIAMENAIYMAVMRTLVGISMGILMVVTVALIPEIFENEEQRGKIFGINNAFMAGIGAVLGLVAGMFATTSWQSVFKVYWVSVPIFIMTILFIPKTPAEGKRQAGHVQERIPLYSFGSLAISYIIFSMIYSVIFYLIGLFVAERGLGDESLVGLFASLGTVGSAIACAIFGYVYPKLKSVSIMISYVGMAAGFLVLLFTNTVIAAGAACTVMGASFGFGITYFLVHTSVIVPPTRLSYAFGLITAAGSIGMFASTYLVTFLQGVLGINTVGGTIPAALGILAIGGVISLVQTIKEGKTVVVKEAVPAPSGNSI